MKNYIFFFIPFLLVSLFNCGCSSNKHDQQQTRQIYKIKIYHFNNRSQQFQVEHYLEEAYLPALHRLGIKHIGVFKPIEENSDQRIYVFVPFKSFAQLVSLPSELNKDKQYQIDGKTYIQAKYNQSLYDHIESILLKAFKSAPEVQESHVNEDKSDRVYELRSYGSPTEALHRNKVVMFNKAGEINIFNKLNFNPLFYGDVLFGSNMPNLMYMITFKNMASRDKHWKAFYNDSTWKRISSMDRYQNNVSRVENYFLYPTEYSDI